MLAEELATRPEPLAEATGRPQSRKIGRELGGIEALLRAGGAAAVEAVKSYARKLGRASVQMKSASRLQTLSLGRSTPSPRPHKGISVEPLGSVWGAGIGTGAIGTQGGRRWALAPTEPPLWPATARGKEAPRVVNLMPNFTRL